MIIIENITVSQYQNINKDISNTKHSLYEGEGGGLLLRGIIVICLVHINILSFYLYLLQPMMYLVISYILKGKRNAG
jgi:hypothetical protein